LPQDHALARAPRLSRSALLREPLVLFPRDIAPSLFDAVLSWYHAQGASPRIAQEAIQMQTIVNLVSAGLGLAWGPARVTQLPRPGGGSRARRGGLAAGAPECETSLLWRPDAPACVARFVGFVQQRLGELGAAVGTNRRERSARRGTRC
ncbi:MAG: LysR substrate-binding domain-containing protein, partial [Aquabacterium sp.]|nr:LysR substrate-binding domain-containing protein [Aquabacterium sp.]